MKKRYFWQCLCLTVSIVAIMAATAPDAAAQGYVVEELVHPAGTMVQAAAVNNLGDVAGHTTDPATYMMQGFVWAPDSGFTELGSLPVPEHNESNAYEISDAGQVAGASLYWDWDLFDYAGSAILWTPGSGMEDLGTFGGYKSQSWGLNEAGQVVGESMMPDDLARAFLWDPVSGIQDLGLLPLPDHNVSKAIDINDLGTVVGISSIWNPTSYWIETRTFVWDPVGGMQEIEVAIPGYEQYIMPNAINDAGVVVGTAYTPSFGGGPGRAFRWDPVNGATDLGVLFGPESSYASDVDNEGRVVGEYDDRAVIWTERTGMVELSGLLPGDFVYSVATSISDAGYITIQGYETGGTWWDTRSFRLAPDLDEDGVEDAEDNCPEDPNPDQVDADDDGWGSACDCDDADPSANPGAEEICTGGVDEDCDGLVDGEDPDCPAEFTLDLDASHEAGILSLIFTVGTPETAGWGAWLVLTSPSIQTIPLWWTSLPVLDPPYEIPVSFPLAGLGWIGIWTGLFTEGGAQAVDLAWVDTG